MSPKPQIRFYGSKKHTSMFNVIERDFILDANYKDVQFTTYESDSIIVVIVDKRDKMALSDQEIKTAMEKKYDPQPTYAGTYPYVFHISVK